MWVVENIVRQCSGKNLEADLNSKGEASSNINHSFFFFTIAKHEIRANCYFYFLQLKHLNYFHHNFDMKLIKRAIKFFIWQYKDRPRVKTRPEREIYKENEIRDQRC